MVKIMNKLDEMIAFFQETNCMNDGDTNVNADLFNQVNQLLGCELDITQNKRFPNSCDGSHLLVVLMYQNLLLAKRVEKLEEQLFEVVNHGTI
tara:strand:- start:1073 stop:1351 length:279 start_codon:yes stop_codon:yes gene_type:complete